MDKHTQTTEQQHFAFKNALIRTLNESVAELDEGSLQRLGDARIAAINSSGLAKSRKWISASVAASVAMLLCIPMALQHHNSPSLAVQDVEMISPDTLLSPEDLDDIDMLIAMEGNGI